MSGCGKETRQLWPIIFDDIYRTLIQICHGVRNGSEVAWLRNSLKIEVIGTEISDSATLFSDVIQWDFHNVKPEWIGAVDFIYSNALDHSFSPKACIAAWVSCLKAAGRLFVHWSPTHDSKHFGLNGANCSRRRQRCTKNFCRFTIWLKRLN